MILRNPKNLNDIEKCLNLYLSIYNNNFIVVDPDYIRAMISQHIRLKKFFKMCEESHEIISFIIAKENQLLFSAEKVLQVISYCSNQKGIKSANLVKLMHREVIEEAKIKNISKVISESSPLDDKQILVKILEYDGWIRKGHMAIYNLDF